MNQIKNIVFDLGGVLLDLDKQRCIDAFAALGFPQIEHLVDLYHPAEILNALERGDVTPRQVYDYIRHEAQNQAITDEQIRDAYCRFLLTIPTHKLELILRLRHAGLRTYLLSNTNEVVWDDVERKFIASGGRPIDDYFDHLYLSFRMHDLKPSHSIFEQMIADSGMRPEETLFLDDGVRNVEAARELEFHVYMPTPRENFDHLFDQILN